ncbi:hypothetical protein Scep_007202 [Stephania cephalantha]|uniref:Uncharacterized protein n=1 Tax=Stephania cephalantha TaxID=152367 RepID=A0AAP0KAN6_9MAGN
MTEEGMRVSDIEGLESEAVKYFAKIFYHAQVNSDSVVGLVEERIDSAMNDELTAPTLWKNSG